MLRASSLVPVLAIGLLVACGGKSFETGDGTDGGSAGSAPAGSSSGARDGGGSSAGGTASGGTASGGTGSGGTDQCEPADYADDMGGSVPVRIVNKTATPIYLGQQTLGCAGGPSFQVADAMGQPLSSPGFCETTCEMRLTGGEIGCPSVACALGGVTTLQPGESTLSQWSALRTETLQLPAACKHTGVTACNRIADVEPGTYYFSAEAGSSMKCGGEGPDGAASCSTCMPSGSGGCLTYGAVVTAPLLEAKVEVMLDGSYGIGGPGGGGMVREVVIEFD